MSKKISELDPIPNPPSGPELYPVVQGGVTYKITHTELVEGVTEALVDPFLYKGGLDCSANPNYPAADAGHVYKVTVAGKVGGGSGPDVEVGDTMYCTTDSSASGNHATVGANWAIIQANSELAAAIADAKPIEHIIIACSDETTALAAGTAKVTFRMPYAFTLSAVRASVSTAPTGSVLTVDINEGGSTILSTKITIDDGEKTSTTAATPPVISDASLADDAEMTIDIDGVGSTVAGTGLKVTLIGRRT